MKKIFILAAIVVVLVACVLGCFSITFANMFAPEPNRQSTGIMFKEFNDVSVLSEHLTININYNGTIANIAAKYKMKNLTDKSLSVETMFISPQAKKYSQHKVFVNGKGVESQEEIYKMPVNSKDLAKNDWETILEKGEKIDKNLSEGEYDFYCENGLVAVKYNLPFEPKQTIDVGVYYSQPLGGYPKAHKFYVHKPYGTLDYYLTPAKYWNGFQDLTIDVFTNEPMAKIKSSSIEFEKVSDLHYQFKSNKLPNQELNIEFCDYTVNNVIREATSPMFWQLFAAFLAILTLVVSIVICVMAIKVKLNKKDNKDV